MTPYAVLLVRPADTDDDIRKRFHVLARCQHPDREGAAGKPGDNWFPISQAYGQIRTAGLRAAWERTQKMMSGLCKTCSGSGVTGGRLGGVKVCAACKGAGRVKK